MAEPGYRVVALLTAKAGKEQELLDFTLSVIDKIRDVDGLTKVEVNRDINSGGTVVLYYWWLSPEHSRRYVDGPVFASFADELFSFVEKHEIYVLANVS